MNESNYIEVTDKSGWHKRFLLQKSIVYIGSDASNDIVLDPIHGQGVAPRHLQLVVAGGSPSPFRAVNVGDAGIVLHNAEDQVLPPRTAAEICDGEQVKMGDFLLQFHLSDESAIQPPARGQPVQAPFSRPSMATTSDPIGLQISLAGTRLEPEIPLEGVITVCNFGGNSRAQFHLDLEGLDPDHYEMGAGPFLYPQAEKTMRLRLHHPCQPSPPAGWHTIMVHATAPMAYPEVKVTAVQQIDLQPFYHHTLRLLSGN